MTKLDMTAVLMPRWVRDSKTWDEVDALFDRAIKIAIEAEK